MKSIFRKWILGLLTLCVAGLGGCSDDPDGINNELELDRALTPLNFTASVLSTGNQVRLTWDVRRNTSYEVVVYSDEGLTQQVRTVSEIAPADVPVIVELEAERSYYVTVQAFSDIDRAPSNAAVAGPVETYAIMDPLNPVVTDRAATSVTLEWDQDDFVTHILASPVASADEPKRLDLSAEQIRAAQATIDGLNPSTQYTVSLFYNSAGRGGQTVWTRPDLTATTRITTVEQLMQAFVDGGKYELAYSDMPYVVPIYDAIAGEVNPASKLAVDLEIYGETTMEGGKPKIQGLSIGLNPGIANLHLEDLSFDGDGESRLMGTAAAVAMTEVSVKNCDLTNYQAQLFYENHAGSAIQTILFDGVYATDIAGSGGDWIDLRTASTHGSLTVCNSTFYNGGRSFLRIDANETFSSVVVRNNTIANFATASGTNGILYVRGTVSDSYVYTHNVFMNENAEQSRFVSRNASAKMPGEIAANYFFNCAETFFPSTTVDGAVTLETALQGGGKVLDADPCENSLRGRLYLTNGEIASARVGDPRWWTAVAPVIPEQTELNTVSEATVWNFADTEAFEPQEIKRNKIVGNLQFYVAGEEAPMAVTADGTISFAKASVVSREGIPTDNALAFRVSGPGSILLTAADAGYNTHMEVIVDGGVRYAFPADGKQSKFGFGDIAAETMIYVCSCSPVELQSLEWSLEVISGGEPQPLAAPVFTTTDIPSVDQGTSQPVTIEWGAVANAAAYEVTFNGRTETVETPSYTIPAGTVAGLAAGTYELSVKAKAAEGSLNWTDSEVASVTFRIKGVLTTVSTAYTWNIADAAAFPAGAITETSVYGNLQFLVTDASKPITIEHSIGEQGEAVDRFKFGGKSTLDGVTPTHRGLALRVSGNGTLTVKAVSSSSSDATREVGVSANGKEYLREACPTSSDGEAKTVVFDDLTGETLIYIYCYSSINIYALSWEPGPGSVTPPAPESVTWNFSSAEFSDLIARLTAVGSDGLTDLNETINGLSIITDSHNVRGGTNDAGSYIQPNGSGSMNYRVFSFTASASGKVRVVTSNTGNSASSSPRYVTVQIGDDVAGAQSQDGGAPSTSPVTLEFDIAVSAETPIYIYPSSGLRFYSIEYIPNN